MPIENHSTPHLFKTERSKLLNKQLRVHNIHYFQQAGIEWTLNHYTTHIPHQIAYKSSFCNRPQCFLCETEKFSSY